MTVPKVEWCARAWGRRWLRLLLGLLFRFRAYHEEVLRAPGPLLLVPNHQSLIDWLFLGVCLEGDWKFVVSEVAAGQNWLRRRVALNRRTFAVDATSPSGFKRVAQFLQGGGRVVLFAEGRLSRTGSLMKLFEGTGFLLHRTGARVVTCYLRGAAHLPTTVHRNRRKWLPRVTAHFSDLQVPPAFAGARAAEARGRLTEWLRDRMVEQQFAVEMTMGPRSVLTAVARTARCRRGQEALEDSTHRTMTYGRLMVGVDLLAGHWRRVWGDAPGARVGVLLPNVNSTPVVLLSLWAADKVPVILNPTSGCGPLLECVRQAGLRFLLTSRAFVERTALDLEPLEGAGCRLVWLEEVRDQIWFRKRVASYVRQELFPGWGLRDPSGPTAVVLFTSGSEGQPKGVELTHANLLANIRQVLAVTDVEDHDRLFNAMPVFHSYGLTIGTLLPLVRGVYVFLYVSPLHSRVIPSLIYDRDCTLLLGTNTFLEAYARNAHPYDFHRVRCLFAGAERVQEKTARTWAERFGVRILEGYGVTECSPVVSVNTLISARLGSAGRPLPGVECRVEPVPGIDSGGRLLVRGPNVMRGYIDPEVNARFKDMDGWYDTGDLARVDADGFIFVLGRLRRFAKVSGEMISLAAVEEALVRACMRSEPAADVAVLSRPDAAKGETLVAVTTSPDLDLEGMRAAIRAAGLSNLCVPRQIVRVKEIPRLPTGKVDHPRLAESLFPAASSTD